MVRRMGVFAVASVYLYLMIWEGLIAHRDHFVVSALVVGAFFTFFSNEDGEASPVVLSFANMLNFRCITLDCAFLTFLPPRFGVNVKGF